MRLHLPALLFLSLFVSFAAHARTLTGVVTHVTDGDTLWVRAAGADSAVSVRLQGIDAPEICQAFGRQARDAMAARVLHKSVVVDMKARDKYHRIVGRVTVQGEDVGSWLVARGDAWTSHYRRRAGPYAREESQARAARRGLWAAARPLEPRLFRQRHGSCHAGR